MGAGANYPKPIAPFMQYALPLQTAIRIEFVAAGAEARFKQPQLPLKAGGRIEAFAKPPAAAVQSKAMPAAVVWQRPSLFPKFQTASFFSGAFSSMSMTLAMPKITAETTNGTKNEPVLACSIPPR